MSTKRPLMRKLQPLLTTLSLILPLLFVLSTPVSAATVTVCATGCDYPSITAAVAGETYPVTINVYPDTYNESVDLYKAAGGDVTLNTVNAGGTPTPGTAIVDGGTTGEAFNTSLTHSGNITINGFVVKTAKGSGVGYDYLGIHLHVNSDVVIRNVTASNTGQDGIRVDEAGGSVTITDCTANDNEGDGIHLWDVVGNLTITGSTTNDNGDKGTQVEKKVGGDVLISDCTSNSNVNEGIQVQEGAGGKVTIRDCTANGNDGDNICVDLVDGDVTITGCITNGDTDEEGIDVSDTGGDVTIRDCTANDNSQGGIEVRRTGGIVTISNCTANGNNSDDGFYVGGLALATASAPDEDDELEVHVEVEEDDEPDDLEEVEKQGVRPTANGGNVTITNCTANGNSDSGFRIEDVNGDVKITASVARDNNDDGVQLDELGGTTLLVNGSIICGNGDEGLQLSDSLTVDARGNWWGCTTGPGTGACDTIDEASGTANDTPWIDTIAASGPAAVMAGSSAVVTFQFSDSAKTVFLGEGPGDLHGDPTFIVTTDNGTVIDPGFINAPQGVLAATLMPAFGGTATVTVDGPCGLDAFITLEAWEFVPEPGSVVLLTSGLVGLAGYAGLRLRRK